MVDEIKKPLKVSVCHKPSDVIVGIVVGVFVTLLMGVIVWGVYEAGADRRYFDCALETATQHCENDYNSSILTFNPTTSLYTCSVPRSLFGLEAYEKQLTELEINLCWAKSKSMLKQLD